MSRERMRVNAPVIRVGYHGYWSAGMITGEVILKVRGVVY
jgi:hypothetical protein